MRWGWYVMPESPSSLIHVGSALRVDEPAWNNVLHRLALALRLAAQLG